jgi:hypothetical protein
MSHEKKAHALKYDKMVLILLFMDLPAEMDQGESTGQYVQKLLIRVQSVIIFK